MAVYYKFKSAKDYDSVPLEGHFMSVGNLKEKIFELKHLGRGTDFDLVVTNAQTNEEYLDEATLIPKNTSVLIRRVPGRPRLPIVTAPVVEQQETHTGDNPVDFEAGKGSFPGSNASAMKYVEDTEWDEFGTDLYAIPEAVSVQSSVPIQDAFPVSKEDEESKIKALIDTPALDWQHQPSDGFGPGRGFGRGMGGRMMGGRGFGRGGFEKKTPPPGYVCHRCKVPGHFIQHCPTNGDPNFDIKRVKHPTGIPRSMLEATPDGSYALPSGAVAVLKPNEAAFEKEIEGMPSTRPVGDLPPELHCPLCKEVMKDAVLTSKCCFTSFCDRCIRDSIISKSMCVCGATSILADDLLPNKTLRDTINRILESNNNSAENGGSAFQVQDMESRNPQAKVPSPTQSAASKGQQEPTPPPQKEEIAMVAEISKGPETSRVVETVEENKSPDVPLPMEQEKGKAPRLPDVSEATHDSKTIKEAASPGSAQVDEEVQQRLASGEAAKKKKKKKVRMHPGAAEMQWRNPQEFAPENYLMPMAPSAAFNPYWNGMQPGLDGFMPPYPGPMPYMGYGLNPMDMAFGGVIPHDPFGGGPGCMIPPYGGGPQRDLAELAMGGFNHGPPIMSREEFEARKADLKRKREMERGGQRQAREMPKEREYGREGSSTVDVSSKSKSRPLPLPPSAADHRHRSDRRSPDRRSDIPRPSSKKKPDSHDDDRNHHHRSDRRDYPDESHRHRDHLHRRRSASPAEPPAPPASSAAAAAAAAEKRQKASVFSRISYPENDLLSSKKRKSSDGASGGSSSSHRTAAPGLSNGHHEEHHHKTAVAPGSSSRKAAAVIAADESSDEERHFKRRPSRYNSSPPAAEEDHRRGRERERERDRGGYSKHR